jgi:hypothetical protein
VKQVIGLAVLLMLGPAAATAQAAGFKGQIILTSESIGGAKSDGDLAKQVKKASVKAPKKEGDGWDLQFVAFLKSAPGVPEINLVVYEGKDAKTYVNAFDISTSEKATTLQAKVRMSESDGLKSGKAYTLRIARKVDGKEVVYAQTVVTLP